MGFAHWKINTLAYKIFSGRYFFPFQSLLHILGKALKKLEVMPAHLAEWISSIMTSAALRRACRRLPLKRISLIRTSFLPCAWMRNTSAPWRAGSGNPIRWRANPFQAQSGKSGLCRRKRKCPVGKFLYKPVVFFHIFLPKYHHNSLRRISHSHHDCNVTVWSAGHNRNYKK